MEQTHEIVKFSSFDGKIYEIDTEKLQHSSFLKKMYEDKFFKKEFINDAIKLEDDSSVLGPIFHYLNTGNVTDDLPINSLEYFGIYTPPRDVETEFLKIQLREHWERIFTKNNPRTKKIHIKDVVPYIPKRIEQYSKNIALFSQKRHFNIKEDFTEQAESYDLDILNIHISKYKGKLVLAGGSLVSLLLGEPVNDYDFFFVGVNEIEAESIMEDFISGLWQQTNSSNFEFSTNRNCCTINCGGKKVQIIFRIYKNIDEILLGFDIDSSCIVYDGAQIWFSERSFHAFKYHVNIVDFTRMSPTYEYRLYKYSLRGFDVHVPMFDVTKICINSPIYRYSECITIRFDQNTGEMYVIGNKRTSRNRAKRKHIDNQNVSTTPSNTTDVPLPNQNNIAIHDINHFYDYKISGLDILLFFGYCIKNASVKKTISPSDYMDGINDNSGKMVFFKISNYEIYFVSSMSNWVSLRKHRSVLITGKDFINLLNQVLQAKDCMPKWRIENPGQQITSSFHSIVLNDYSTWFRGIFYDAGCEQEPETRVKYIKL